jgi:hypothetical protein
MGATNAAVEGEGAAVMKAVVMKAAVVKSAVMKTATMKAAARTKFDGSLGGEDRLLLSVRKGAKGGERVMRVRILLV